MTTIDWITDLFCRIDDRMQSLPKHPQATLWPSEVVTLGVLHALKGVGNRAFYRWLTRPPAGSLRQAISRMDSIGRSPHLPPFGFCPIVLCPIVLTSSPTAGRRIN